MKINQSTIAMASARESSKAFMMQMTVSERLPTMREEPEKSKPQQQKEKDNGKQAATLELSDTAKKQQVSRWDSFTPESEESFEVMLIRRFMESLRALREGRRPDYRSLQHWKPHSVKPQQDGMKNLSLTGGGEKAIPKGHSRVTLGGVWQEKVTMSTIFAEREVTSFSSAGVVQTEDGRSISFNLNLEMSREFIQATSMEYARKIFCVDPLVINLNGSPAEFSDKTFFFDLDADGKEEELAQLSANSGFLALDKNGDGVINDGSELFGTKSGDGFKDLAAYDEDGNGWIDENDSVFDRLKIWTMDEDGNSKLVAAGKAGVGALYLGSADTEFSLKDAETNATKGVIRKTGVFLKESGEVGTLQHVDMVV